MKKKTARRMYVMENISGRTWLAARIWYGKKIIKNAAMIPVILFLSRLPMMYTRNVCASAFNTGAM